MIKGSKILITGGLGAIGSALSREVLKKGAASLTIIDDNSSSNPALSEDILSDSRVTFIADSVVNDAALSKAFAGVPEIVFHLAANFANQNSVEHPIIDCEVNSIGTVKVLEQARKNKVKKFIFASSSCVYGNAEHYSPDTKDFHLDTPYAINKLHGEYLVKFYHEYHKMDAVILRYFNSFGPGELPGKYRNVIPNFFALAMQGKVLPITGDKDTARDFNYVDNTVQGTLLATEHPASGGKIYNIGSGSEVAIVKLAEVINSITGNKAGIEWHPARSWDTIKRRRADIMKTADELGYSPVLDFEGQLKTTYEWLKKHEQHFRPL